MKPQVVLVHGAWQGGWVWDSIVPQLAEAGIDALAVDLPGSAPDVERRETVTFADRIDCLRQIVEGIEAPVYVVGHGGGGLAASQIAEVMPERIAGLVYVAGMMLPDGMSFAQLAAACCDEEPSAAGVRPKLELSDGLSRVPPAAAIETFYHDCDPREAAAAAARLTPQSNAARDVAPRITAERFGSVPRVYIETLKDRAIMPFVQRRMQVLVPGAVVRSLDTGHAPMLADPEALADILLYSVSALRSMSRERFG